MPKPGTVLGLTLAGLAVSLLPVWGSGMRRHISFLEFVYVHTILGPDPEYIPEEEFTKPLTLAEIRSLPVSRPLRLPVGRG